MAPLDFLSLATELTGVPQPSEARCRSAISRAYYAIFLTIQCELKPRIGADLQRRAQLSSQLGHDWMITQLKNCGVTEIESIGQLLNDLKYARRVADYDMKATVDPAAARTEVENAIDLRNRIASFGLPKIVAAVLQKVSADAKHRSGT